MYKRLLALLVFVPMFLIAWYARNTRQATGFPGNASLTESPSHAREPQDPYNRSSREDRPHDERADTRDQDDNSEDQRENGRTGERRRSHRASSTSQPGVFDFYLLNLSWSPEFCATHPDKPECSAQSGFVLHGLWPQNNDGSYPEHCSDAPGPSDASAFHDLYPDSGLLSHEWSTHGTCSGLTPDAFFTQARTALRDIQIPATLGHITQQTAAAPDEILAQFTRANPSLPRESFALSCGNNYLTAIEVCLDRNLHATACNNIRSCRATSIRIVPPGGASIR